MHKVTQQGKCKVSTDSTRASPITLYIPCHLERAELTISNTIELSRNIDLPIMTATAINPTTAPFAFAAGASAIGCGSCINKMDSDLSMMATAKSLVEIASRNALKVVELV